MSVPRPSYPGREERADQPSYLAAGPAPCRPGPVARYPMSMENTRSSSILKRVLAVVVLVLAAFVLFKLIIGIVTALLVPMLIVLAIVAIVWAIRVL